MPFYEYLCTNCGAATEMLQKISDPPATTCPKCNAEALTKQISAAGFRLKGGGWYETDFKSGGQKNLVGGGEGDGAKASGEGKAEAKDASHTCGAGCSHGAAKTETAATSAPASTPSTPAATPSA